MVRAYHACYEIVTPHNGGRKGPAREFFLVRDTDMEPDSDRWLQNYLSANSASLQHDGTSFEIALERHGRRIHTLCYGRRFDVDTVQSLTRKSSRSSSITTMTDMRPITPDPAKSGLSASIGDNRYVAPARLAPVHAFLPVKQYFIVLVLYDVEDEYTDVWRWLSPDMDAYLDCAGQVLREGRQRTLAISLHVWPYITIDYVAYTARRLGKQLGQFMLAMLSNRSILIRSAAPVSAMVFARFARIFQLHSRALTQLNGPSAHGDDLMFLSTLPQDRPAIVYEPAQHVTPEQISMAAAALGESFSVPAGEEPKVYLDLTQTQWNNLFLHGDSGLDLFPTLSRIDDNALWFNIPDMYQIIEDPGYEIPDPDPSLYHASVLASHHLITPKSTRAKRPARPARLPDMPDNYFLVDLDRPSGSVLVDQSHAIPYEIDRIAADFHMESTRQSDGLESALRSVMKARDVMTKVIQAYNDVRGLAHHAMTHHDEIAPLVNYLRASGWKRPLLELLYSECSSKGEGWQQLGMTVGLLVPL
ncbi:hypothetical protein J8273_3876 [Carpediemonas membranifera]|uniref:Uncharacterized protein n=1 Tax=Carpediemonas membranifera TaxID=201153 RepID=A0A8J6B7Z8_9EUKA|nr:hypothetical protein J8273_3876 [Carpediemonas membranifera]|eukprot:KAG9394622.1 hypothetical protein J8273_3876 [Carpediemonas membranifera]